MKRQKIQNNQLNTEEEQSQQTETVQIQKQLQSLSNQANMVLAKECTHTQQNKKESPKIDPYKHSPLIFDKHRKIIQWVKDKCFNKWCQNNWISMSI